MLHSSMPSGRKSLSRPERPRGGLGSSRSAQPNLPYDNTQEKSSKGWREIALEQDQLPALQSQQFFLQGQPAAESGQLAAASDHAMARQNNRNWIGTVGCANGSH